jgi:hypothetical protein
MHPLQGYRRVNRDSPAAVTTLARQPVRPILRPRPPPAGSPPGVNLPAAFQVPRAGRPAQAREGTNRRSAAWCYARGHEVSRWWWADRGRAARREQVRLAAAGQIEAGKRTGNIPSHVLPVLAAHMETWAGPDRVFAGRDGRPMRGDAVR